MKQVKGPKQEGVGFFDAQLLEGFDILMCTGNLRGRVRGQSNSHFYLTKKECVCTHTWGVCMCYMCITVCTCVLLCTQGCVLYVCFYTCVSVCMVCVLAYMGVCVL